jgi:hypothetical protein
MICGLSSRNRVSSSCLLAALAASACGSSGSEESGSSNTSRLAAATAAVCERSECRGDYDVGGCNVYFLYDAIFLTLIADNPDACMSAFETYYACLAEAASCDEPSACGEYPALGSACTPASELDVDPPFDGAEALCQRESSCSGAEEPSEDESDLSACYARFEAESLTRGELGGQSCATAYEALVKCASEVELACMMLIDTEVACPDESAAMEDACEG